jgi:hypothetical protein
MSGVKGENTFYHYPMSSFWLLGLGFAQSLSLCQTNDALPEYDSLVSCYLLSVGTKLSSKSSSSDFEFEFLGSNFQRRALLPLPTDTAAVVASITAVSSGLCLSINHFTKISITMCMCE